MRSKALIVFSMSIGVSLYFGCITALIVVSVFAIRPPKWVYKEYKLAFGYPYFVFIIVAYYV